MQLTILNDLQGIKLIGVHVSVTNYEKEKEV